MSRNFSLSIVLIACLLLSGCFQKDDQPITQKQPNASKKKLSQKTSPSPATSKDVPSKKKPAQPVTKKKHTTKTPNSVPAVPKKTSPRTVHRDSKQTDKQLKAVGIHAFHSKQLQLYSDIKPEDAQKLPALVDQLLPVWQAYYASIPKEKTNRVFPITGYLIKDDDLFTQTKLLPKTIPLFAHGAVQEGRFWMREQPTNYYRRHLMLHEATHCFMTSIPNGQPIWYLEGMAEFFALHRFDENKKATFGVFPKTRHEFNGFDRIGLIERELKAGRFLSIRRVIPLREEHFVKYRAPYAWSWALCQFLDQHPRYQKRFRKLGQLWSGNSFQVEFQKWLDEEGASMETEWMNFISHLEPGFDIPHSAIQFTKGEKLKKGLQANQLIHANKSWQSTGLFLETGETYRVSASGQFTLAQKPKPWVSEPQGVSIRYYRGVPLGKVMGVILAESPVYQEAFVKPIIIGRGTTITAKHSGTLYLRINDSFAELADNTGKVTVTLTHEK